MTSAHDTSLDTTDWTQYPPDRVEGLKVYFRGPTSAEDGPCTEDELKMMCTEWECKVNMKVDNFLFWLIKKTKERDFKGDHQEFVRNMPRIARALRRKGMKIYEQYQEEYGDKNRKYLAYCADWRKNELRRLRWLEKVRAFSSNWLSDDDSEVESASETDYSSGASEGGDKNDMDSQESFTTVIPSQKSPKSEECQVGRGFTSYPDTESMPQIHDIGNEEEVGMEPVDVQSDDVNSQMFLPQTTSTQNDK